MEYVDDPPEFYGKCTCKECTCDVEFGPSTTPITKAVCENCLEGWHHGERECTLCENNIGRDEDTWVEEKGKFYHLNCYNNG